MWYVPKPNAKPRGYGNPYPTAFDVYWALTIKPALICGAIVWVLCKIGWI